jgi:MazG family protein
VLEETYEVVDAIDRHDHDGLREELGDFMLQAVFLAQLEQEEGRFAIEDSVRAIADKLVRRHPHVFKRDEGEAALDTANQVRTRWEEIKTEERGGASKPKTLLSGIPAALPSLLKSYQIASRAASVGFDWEQATDVLGKIREEIEEIDEVVTTAAADQSERLEEEVGDLLFAIANLSRKLGVEPETALRKANDKFTGRFTDMETRVAQTGRAMRDMTLAELEAEWQAVKKLHHEDTKDTAQPSPCTMRRSALASDLHVEIWNRRRLRQPGQLPAPWTEPAPPTYHNYPALDEIESVVTERARVLTGGTHSLKPTAFARRDAFE